MCRHYRLLWGFLQEAQDFESKSTDFHGPYHNTVKFLIGITPQGAISFISKGWEGRVWDQAITEKCGLLDVLHPGDIIVADRGFNVQEVVGLYCAEMKNPKGKKQLSQL